MISFEKAVEIVTTNAIPFGSERVDIAASLNRVLREDVVSDIDMPPFDKSAVDGYACRKSDIRNELAVIGTIAAGSPTTLEIRENQCAKIMTGAVIPKGADHVLMIEQIRAISENKIRFEGETTAVNICFKGEDVVVGDKLVAAGKRITPKEVASLALAGYSRPLVSKKPRVGIIATGDEIVEPATVPHESQIRNSNSYQLLAHAAQFGCDVKYYGISKDSQESIRTLLNLGKQECDLLLLTGGVSMGDLDLVPGLLQRSGFEILFHGVSIQPGRPTVFGRSDNTYVFGIPGNPVASFVVFETLVKEFLAKLMGLTEFRTTLKCILAKDIKRQNSRRLGWRPVRITSDGKAEPVEYHGTAHISAYAFADAIVPIPIDVTEIPKGSVVDVRLI